MAKKREPRLVFKSDSDKLQAKEEFMNLKNHPAWRRIIAYYDKKIEWIEKVINGEIQDDSGKDLVETKEDLKLWRMRRNITMQFRNLPDILIETIDISQTKTIDFDPFEK